MRHILSLKNQQEFCLINKIGTKFYHHYFIAIIAKNFVESFNILNTQKQYFYRNTATRLKKRLNKELDNTNILLLGIKTSKMLRSSVIRNKIKRRARHLVRLIANENVQKTNIQAIVLIAKKGFEKQNFTKMFKVVHKIYDTF